MCFALFFRLGNHVCHFLCLLLLTCKVKCFSYFLTNNSRRAVATNNNSIAWMWQRTPLKLIGITIVSALFSKFWMPSDGINSHYLSVQMSWKKSMINRLGLLETIVLFSDCLFVCLMVFNATFNYYSYIVAVSFISGGNRRTWR